MLRYEIVFVLLAMIPLGIAVLYRAAIVPRRKRNTDAILQFAVTTSEGSNRPEQHEYLTRGRQRVQQDFDSQYTLRLLVPATLLSFFYLVALGLSLARVLQPHCCQDWLLRLSDCLPSIGSYDALLYALLGAYTFNVGVLVRRTFLADVTEHVFWGAIGRLVLTCGLALGVRGAMNVSPNAMYFLIAFMPRVVLTSLRKVASKTFTDSGPAAAELPLQMVQGIDIWKEQRLEEEGIESIQNLATADILTLVVKTHYPIRTLIDWIDQAIVIQRFSSSIDKLRQAGLAVSAIDFAWLSPDNNDGSKDGAEMVAKQMGLDADVMAAGMNGFNQDSYVRVLWALWQNDGDDHGRAIG